MSEQQEAEGSAVECKKEVLECLSCLRKDIDNRNERRILSFSEFLELAAANPQKVFRNIFQLFYDMAITNVSAKEDEYPGDPESIGFIEWDCSKIFADGKDNPFFPDRLLANRFVAQVKDFKRGSQQNRMRVYLGPPGCGKSTFLDNLLQTFEEYTNTEKGQSFEILWNINIPDSKDKEIKIPCPSHDHPILILPKKYRRDILDKLLNDLPEKEKQRFSSDKEYDWIFSGEACTICQSLFDALCNKLGSLDKVLTMINARPYQFNRRIGEGISIYNPGDKMPREMFLSDKQVQERLDRIFGPNRIKYIFSPLARTNNGIYVLMDIKDDNKPRLMELHNVISEGVHKVNGIEERINSLFFSLMNPEDMDKIKEQKVDSFLARIEENKISYVLEAATEVKIYRSIFGRTIDAYFLPRVLDNFARVIISSRMNEDSDVLKDWISPDRMLKYSKKYFCDEKGLLLRMEIYGGVIPIWLSAEDKKKFTAPRRRALITEGASEGRDGFSGRDSLKMFSDFMKFYEPKPERPDFNFITMANVVDFFKTKIDKKTYKDNIRNNFIDRLVDWYDYTVLNEIKEALFFYNEKNMGEDVLDYLCAVNYDPDGREITCKYTNKKLAVTIDFLKWMGSQFTGEHMEDNEALEYAQEIQKKYTEVLARESGKDITETELYHNLFIAYSTNLKKKALDPFVENDSFRQAIKSFGTEEFESADTRIKEHITFMIDNLVKKGYTRQGAKEICIYALDKELNQKFS